MAMHTYKFRAECIADVAAVLIKVSTCDVSIVGCKLKSFWIPDVTVTFTSKWSLAQIKHAISDVEDAHVIIETLAFEDEYTGERYYFEDE